MTPEEEEQVRRAARRHRGGPRDESAPGMPPGRRRTASTGCSPSWGVGAHAPHGDTAPSSVPPATSWPPGGPGGGGRTCWLRRPPIGGDRGGRWCRGDPRGLGGDSASDSSGVQRRSGGRRLPGRQGRPRAPVRHRHRPPATPVHGRSRRCRCHGCGRPPSPRDVQAVEDAGPVGDLASGWAPTHRMRRGRGRAGCVIPPAPPRGADVVAVRLDGRRATLVLGPPHSRDA